MRDIDEQVELEVYLFLLGLVAMCAIILFQILIIRHIAQVRHQVEQVECVLEIMADEECHR